LAYGGAKLKAPAKGSKKALCRVMTLLAPPLTVTHRRTSDEETMHLSAYLVTFNEHGSLTLPPQHEILWGEAHVATVRILKQYAKKSLSWMCRHKGRMPISQTFKQKLGKHLEFTSSEEDSSSSEDEEESE